MDDSHGRRTTYRVRRENELIGGGFGGVGRFSGRVCGDAKIRWSGGQSRGSSAMRRVGASWLGFDANSHRDDGRMGYKGKFVHTLWACAM